MIAGRLLKFRSSAPKDALLLRITKCSGWHDVCHTPIRKLLGSLILENVLVERQVESAPVWASFNSLGVIEGWGRFPALTLGSKRSTVCASKPTASLVVRVVLSRTKRPSRPPGRSGSRNLSPSGIRRRIMNPEAMAPLLSSVGFIRWFWIKLFSSNGRLNS